MKGWLEAKHYFLFHELEKVISGLTFIEICLGLRRKGYTDINKERPRTTKYVVELVTSQLYKV